MSVLIFKRNIFGILYGEKNTVIFVWEKYSDLSKKGLDLSSTLLHMRGDCNGICNFIVHLLQTQDGQTIVNVWATQF